MRALNDKINSRTDDSENDERGCWQQERHDNYQTDASLKQPNLQLTYAITSKTHLEIMACEWISNRQLHHDNATMR